MTEPVVTIGPYTSSEIPPPLVVIFKDENGNAIDFSVGGPWTAKFQYQRHGISAGFAFGASDPAVVVNAAVINADQVNHKGEVQYSWIATDFLTAGDYEGEMGVGNGTNRYISGKYAWHVRAALAPMTV